MMCPFCGKEMQVGSITQSRNSIKWVPKEKDRGMWNLLPVVKGIYITDSMENTEAKTFYCEACRKFIIDQDDLRVY